MFGLQRQKMLILHQIYFCYEYLLGLDPPHFIFSVVYKEHVSVMSLLENTSRSLYSDGIIESH